MSLPAGSQHEILTSVDGVPAAGRQWLVYGDAMRVLGVLAVVLVHTCDMVMFSGSASRCEWWVANVVDATGRWAVPVFIMLSGALLLHPSRQESAGRFYRRRLARLGAPIAFWSAFFILFSLFVTRWASAAWNDPNSIWKDLLKGRPYVHLHFVFRLAGLYAITPMLRVYVRHAPLGLRAQMVVVLLVLGMGNWAVSAVLGSEPTAFSSLWPFLGFYLAGNVLREVTVSRRLLAASCAGFATCWAVMSLGTGFLAPAPYTRLKAFPSIDVMLYDFLSPARVLMSICAWCILAYVFGRIPAETRLQRVMKALAPLTLGIYLVHPFFREVLYVNGWLFSRPNVWVGIPLTALIVAAASTGVTWAIGMVPVLSRIVG